MNAVHPQRWLLPLAAPALCAGLLIGRAAAAAWPGWAALALSAAAAVLLRGPRRIAALALCTACAGVLLGHAAWHPALPAEGPVHVVGVVSEEIRSGNRGQLRTLLRDITLDGKPAGTAAYWSLYPETWPEELAPGATVEFDGQLYAPSGAGNPGGYDFREYLLQRGAAIGLYGDANLSVSRSRFSLWGWAASVRHRLSSRLVSFLGEEAGGPAPAMLFGARTLVATEDRESFNRLGIGHILSVSGFHVGVLFAAVSFLLRRLRTPSGLGLGLETAVLALYCLVTGMNAPVIRAAVLILLAEYGHLRHRQRFGLHLLCAAAVLTLLFQPAQLTSAGFQLTYCALLGLMLIRPVIERLFHPNGRALRALWKTFAASLSVQLAILLPELYWYQELPVLGLVLNTLLFGLSSVLLLLYWAVLLLTWVPGLGPLAGHLAGGVTRLLISGARSLAARSWMTLWTAQANGITVLGWLLLCGGLVSLLAMSRRRRLTLFCAGLVITALSVIPLPHTGSEWIQLSVGSADAAVLRDENRVVVIDAGENATLSTYLHQRRLAVDTLILTHLHIDHAGGLQALVDDRIPVRELLLPWGAEEAAVDVAVPPLLEALRARGTAVRTLSRGDVLDLPGGDITVLWPEAGRVRPGQDANESSLALLVHLHGCTLLTAGDLDGRYEAYSAVPADLLKVAHHGSARSTSAEYLAAVAPRALLLSCGDSARQESMAVRAGDIPLYCTRTDGALTVAFSNGSFRITSYRQAGEAH